MPNRAERRAAAKGGNKGVPQQYDRTRGRARSGMLDEYQLQERSRRLIENGDAEWKPSSSTVVATQESDPTIANPEMNAPHSVRQWFRIVSWTLIALSIIGFFVVMWLPTKPLWLVITISAVFAVAVISLLFVAGDPKHNPNIDGNGTAV